MPSAGALLVLLSAVAFGAMAIFGKLAYDDGATVGTLLATRFTLAAVVLWLVLLGTGRVRTLRALRRRDVLIALALGAVGYAVQAGGYFAALRRIDASLLALLIYTFPAMVAAAAVVLGRERLSVRTVLALVLVSAGLALVLGGAANGGPDAAGVALGLGAAVVYAVYILSSEGVAGRMGPLGLSTLVCTGAAVSLTLGGLAAGDLHPGRVGAEGLGWLAAIALVSTVGAIGLFFAGLARIGPTATSILSTLEPVVTVALASAVFGESLGPGPLLGGMLVLAAVLVVRVPPSRRRLRAAPLAADAPAAGS